MAGAPATPPADAGGEVDDMLRRAGAMERAGEWDDADALYARTFARSLAEGRPGSMADALRRQAEVRRARRGCEEAEELAWLSFEIAERHGLGTEAARALNVAGGLCYARADFERARELYEEALERARAVRDGELVGLACQNLGVLANIRGALVEARAFYLESVAASVRTGDRTAAMLVYHNLGMVCGDLGDWLEAELYFDRGIDLATRAGHLPMLARLHLNRAEPLIQMSEFTRARRSLARADALASQVRDTEVAAGVERFRGVIARLEGSVDEAEAHLARALAMAVDAGAELEQAEATGGLATVRALQGRPAEERSLLEDALGRFRRLGARREAARVEARLGELEAGG